MAIKREQPHIYRYHGRPTKPFRLSKLTFLYDCGRLFKIDFECGKRYLAKFVGFSLLVGILFFFGVSFSGCKSLEDGISLYDGNVFNYNDSVEIYYETVGTGDNAIVMIHGFGASRESWYDILPKLEAVNTTFVLVDLKGFGRSSKPTTGSYDMHQQAQIIVSLLKELSFSEVAIIGHSYGGGIALLIAIDNESSRVFALSSLILIDAAAFSDTIPYFVKYLRGGLLGTFIMAFTPPRIMALTTLKHLFHNDSLIDDERV